MIDGDERELFAQSLRHAAESVSGADLDAAVEDLGWSDALVMDPRTVVSLLFSLQGEATTTSSGLDRVLADRLAPDGDPAGVVLPPSGSAVPPARIEGDRWSVTGLGQATLADRERAIVVARPGDADGNDRVLVLAPVDLALRPVRGVDPDLGLVEVTGTGSVEAGMAGADPVDWTGAVAAGRIALGHELVGIARTMLRQAREHALERIQFGQPIARFQAVRHRLAETLVAIETADALLEAAWLDGRPDTAAMAKAQAGRSARIAARHCQQVLAGIGFTTEHDLHRSVRRVLVLDELLGASRTLTRALGEELLGSRTLPPLLPL